MKKETILKLLTIMIVGVILVTMSVNVFAATSDDSFFTDITDQVDQTGNALEGVQENSNDKKEEQEESTNNNYDTEIPEAGIAENTVMVIVVIALAGVAVVAYNRMKYYKNI